MSVFATDSGATLNERIEAYVLSNGIWDCLAKERPLESVDECLH